MDYQAPDRPAIHRCPTCGIAHGRLIDCHEAGEIIQQGK